MPDSIFKWSDGLPGISFDADAIHDNEAGEINAIDSATIADNDVMLFEDSSDSYAKKKTLWSALKNLFTPADHVGAGGAAHADVTTSVDGFMTATDKTKLDGIVVTGAKAYKSTNQSISDSTWQTLSFSTQNFDYVPSGITEMWSSGSPGRITIRVAGIYYINAYGKFAANATGFRGIRLTINATEKLREFEATLGATYDHPLHISYIGEFSIGDYVQAEVWQNSGGSLDFVNPYWLAAIKQN